MVQQRQALLAEPQHRRRGARSRRRRTTPRRSACGPGRPPSPAAAAPRPAPARPGRPARCSAGSPAARTAPPTAGAARASSPGTVADRNVHSAADLGRQRVRGGPARPRRGSVYAESSAGTDGSTVPSTGSSKITWPLRSTTVRPVASPSRRSSRPAGENIGRDDDHLVARAGPDGRSRPATKPGPEDGQVAAARGRCGRPGTSRSARVCQVAQGRRSRPRGGRAPRSRPLVRREVVDPAARQRAPAGPPTTRRPVAAAAPKRRRLAVGHALGRERRSAPWPGPGR